MTTGKVGDRPTLVVHDYKDIIEFVNRGAGAGGGSLAIVLIALGGTFIDAYDFTSLGVGTVSLRHQLQLSPLLLGSVTAIMAFGALVGALVGGYYIDKIGRLRMFLLDLVFFVIAALGAALAWNAASLMVFRFLMGLGVGLDFPVALSFVAEYTARGQKGKFINLWQGMWYVAATIVFLLSLLFYALGAGDDIWRWTVGFGALPAAVILLLRYRYMAESPMWAALQGDLGGAASILERTYRVRVQVAPDARAFTPLADLYSIEQWRSVFSPRYRARTTLNWIIGATQSLEYYAVGFYLPVISLAIVSSNFVYAILASIVFNVFGIVGGFSQAQATHRVGVRRLAMLGYAGVILALLVAGLTYHRASILIGAAAIAFFILAHSFGPGSQGKTMATLSYPTWIRGAGVGWHEAFTRCGSIVGFYFFPLLNASLGLGSTLLTLIVVPLIGLVTCLAIRWEPITADVDAEEPAPAIRAEA
jgi:putative MFS transporter